MTSRRICAVCGTMLDDSRPTNVCQQCESSRFRSEEPTLIKPPSEAQTVVRSETDHGNRPAAGTSTPQDHVSEDPDAEGCFGAYRDLEEIAKWQYGTIYNAYDRKLDRPVRLCVLQSELPAADQVRQDFLERVQVLSRINHANVVTTLAAGIQDGVAFVVHERIDGNPVQGFLPRNMQQRFVEGFYPGIELYRIMRDALMGLKAVHESGIAFGDFNLDSILIDQRGNVRIAPSPNWIDDSDSMKVDENRSLTDLMQSDIHCFGWIFYQLVTGEYPHITSDNATQPVSQRLRSLNSGLSSSFCELIERLLESGEKEVDLSVDTIVDELNKLLDRRVIRARWRPRIFSQFLGCFSMPVILALLPTDRLPDPVLLLLFVAPIGYIIVMESLVGWTVFRRLFGLRLYDVSGQLASVPRRFVRAVCKFGIFIFTCLLSACLMPLFAMLGPDGGEFTLLFGFMLVAVLAISIPIGLLYVPSIWIKNHWTFYDLLTGTTWAEEICDRPVKLDKTKATVDTVARPDSRVVTGSVDQYDLYETLGIGGMGSVFRARDRILQREVAIKVLAGHLADDSNLLLRFQREAKMAANISHSNVAKVFDNGIFNDAPYIALEFVEGQDLNDRVVNHGPLSVGTAWSFVMQAAKGLRAADQLGVVHRDIKPANLMATADNDLKIMDFGISQQSSIDIELTQVGDILGTPVYMSPEQAKGEEVDHRSDIYSLGMTLYFLLSGQPPFSGSNQVQILAQQMSEDPEPLPNNLADWTVARERVMQKMIAKDPAERYQDYDELLSDLQRTIPGVDRLAKPAKRIAAAMCTLTCVIILITMINVFAALFLIPLLPRRFESQYAETIFGLGGLLSFTAIIFIYVVGVYFRGRTTGKRLLGLRVCSANGRKLKFSQASIRFFAQYPYFAMTFLTAVISLTPYQIGQDNWTLISNVLFVINALLLAISTIMLWQHPRRQALHDLAAGTIVERSELN